MNPQIIAFDADDTLWKNETFFQEIEKEFCELFSGYLPTRDISEELYKTEMQNIRIYGYGIKSFTLSMIETALRINHVEIMSDKCTGDYIKLMKALDCSPGDFMMIGNSMKSDIIPVLELGGSAVYVPFEVTWAHEQVGKDEINEPGYRRVECIDGVLDFL